MSEKEVKFIQYADMLSLNNEIYILLSKNMNPTIAKMDIDNKYKDNIQKIFIKKATNSVPYLIYSITEKENHKILFDVYNILKDLIETEFETFATNTYETDQFVFVEGYLKKYEGVSFRIDCSPSLNNAEVSFCYK